MPEQDWTSLDARARAVLRANDGIAHVSAFDAADVTRRQVGALRGRGVLELESHREVHVHVDEHDSRLRHSRNSRWVLAAVADDESLELHWGRRHDRPTAGRASLVDALLLLVGCVPEPWFIAALDAALHQPRDGRPMLDAGEYERLASLLPRRLRHLLRQVDPSAESCLETLLRLAMIRRGIGPILLQAQPHPAHRVDFLVRGRLIVEADGAAFHDPERDRIRDAELRAQGYIVLRFDYAAIVFDIERVLDEIEAAVAAL